MTSALPALAASMSCGSSEDNGPTDAAPLDASPGDGSAMDGASPNTPSVIFSVTLRVIDEAGAPVAGATVDLGGQPLSTDAAGEVVVRELSGPVMAVIDKAGFLAEPIPLGRADASTVVEVRLFSELGGTRWAMHNGGDVMLGRRYEAPAHGAPLLPADDLAGGARRVVASVSRAFAAADLRMINLETVLTEDPASNPYLGKGVVIGSRPETLAGVQALGVDAVVLANNHIRDYLDVGVAETQAALDAAGIPHVGASAGSEPADEPLVFERGGVRIGVLAWSTLDGSFANDAYPQNGEPVPPDISPTDAWAYEQRYWGFVGSTWTVPYQSRRIGTAWRMFKEQEPSLAEAEAAAAWDSLEAVYPELQDWVARRGHGGAAYWVTAKAKDRIAALATSTDLVVVQLHSGLEFQDAPSDFTTRVAHAAVDAGADIVIIHHPHVVQGFEWYKGSLIAFSLGNFVFDQDFFITFPSAFLRTVWEGERLLEARMVPLQLESYQPKPMTDEAATRQILSLWERSVLGTVADRDASGEIRELLVDRAPESRAAHLRLRHHGAVLTPTPPAAQTLELAVPAGAVVPVDYAGLVSARAGGADVLVGRDLFGWGSFEDALVDGAQTGLAYWWLEGNGDGVALQVDESAAAGVGQLVLRRSSTTFKPAVARALERMPIPEHRFYTLDPAGIGVPADGEASYSLRLLARMKGICAAYLRLDFYVGDGTGITKGPAFEELILPIDIPADNGWHVLDLPVPAEALLDGTTRAGAILPQVGLNPPPQGECELGVDDLSLIEWRPAASMPEHHGAYEYVRNPGATESVVRFQVLPVAD